MTSKFVAALDLGSNSFHMIVARRVGDELRVVDRLREPVRLAGGLGPDRRISEYTRRRALDCLERFGQRLRELNPGAVRAVGTNTLRSAKNGDDFRVDAERLLGVPVEVISGQEEARLIYLGVSHTTDTSPGRRLVVDIGGGSTEVIVGEGFDIVRGHSLYMGCVSFSDRYFGSGELTRDAFDEARTAASVELVSVEREVKRLGWHRAFGASGTIRAVGAILEAEGWADGDVTASGLRHLRHHLIDAGSLEKLRLKGLKSDRGPVIAGGVAILSSVFDRLEIESMDVATGALREGVVYDLIGRLDREDVRERTIQRFVSHFHIDVDQANRVEATAQSLLRDVADDLGSPVDRAAEVLHWAAQLHELGLDISFTGYHKHSAYVIENAHMPGFSADDQRLVAVVVRNHRRGLKQSRFDSLPAHLVPFVRRLTAILRLAVIWNRGRVASEPPRLSVDGQWGRLGLHVSAAWADEHPLTLADLDDEISAIGELGTELVVERDT